MRIQLFISYLSLLCKHLQLITFRLEPDFFSQLCASPHPYRYLSLPVFTILATHNSRKLANQNRRHTPTMTHHLTTSLGPSTRQVEDRISVRRRLYVLKDSIIADQVTHMSPSSL
jgi:hypothetical protein